MAWAGTEVPRGVIKGLQSRGRGGKEAALYLQLKASGKDPSLSLEPRKPRPPPLLSRRFLEILFANCDCRRASVWLQFAAWRSPHRCAQK